jgi:hypothetical protein
MHGALEVVHQQRGLNAVLGTAIARGLEFLLKIFVRTIMLSRVWFADVNSEKLESLIAIAVVQFIEGRDLARKRRSRDTAKLKQYMLLASKCGEANPVTFEIG